MRIEGKSGDLFVGGQRVAGAVEWSIELAGPTPLPTRVDHFIFGDTSRTWVIPLAPAGKRFFRRWRGTWRKPQRARYPSDGGRRR